VHKVRVNVPCKHALVLEVLGLIVNGGAFETALCKLFFKPWDKRARAYVCFTVVPPAHGAHEALAPGNVRVGVLHDSVELLGPVCFPEQTQLHYK
jgi:hypothetical protein